MPRPVKPIDQLGMQKIADSINPGQFSNAMALCSHIATRYNNEIFPHNQSAQVDHQLVKLRINAGVIKLAFPMPIGRRGRQPGVKISQEQKEKMQAGRVNKKKIATVANGDGMQKWQKNMQEFFDNKKILCDGVLSGKKNAAIKAMCINCVGGYQNRSPEDPPIANAIRDCRGYSCPLYAVRPFQKKANNNEET